MLRELRVIEIAYVRPAKGGVHDYSRVIETLVDRHLPAVRLLDRSPPSSGLPVLAWLAGFVRLLFGPRRVHLELGAQDRRSFWMVWVLSRVRNLRLIVTIHDPTTVVKGPFMFERAARGPWPWPGVARRLRSLLNERFGRRAVAGLLREAQSRICASPVLEEIEGVEVVHVPHPVFNHRPVANDTPRPVPTVGYVGYWGHKKGLDTLADAISILAARGIAADFVIGGRGMIASDPHEAALRRRLEDMPNVRLPGFLGESELPAMISSFTLLVVPYRATHPGGASGVVMRAMELGTTIVATRTPGLLAQIGEEGAFFAAPDDVTDLAEKIETALADPKRAKRMARANQERVLTNNSWEVVAARLGPIYGAVSSP